MSDFHVSSTTGQIEGVTFYFIESTAPDNVDPPPDPDIAHPAVLRSVPADEAVKQIAGILVPPDDPGANASLVVMVHGFNNPPASVLRFYEGALKALQADKDAIFGDPRRKVVCIGYRWPSESIGQVMWSSLEALPLTPLWLFGIAAVILVLRLLGWLVGFFNPTVGWLAWLSTALTLAAVALFALNSLIVLLRGIVYFRDVYRAINYGVPDLVEVIRQVDREASGALVNAAGRSRNRVSLSFIGHSMGGLVVTEAIRVLSDVFDSKAIRTTLSGRVRAQSEEKKPIGEAPGKIGHVFTLARFVLASPDIPAETLLTARANFLASSLRRFREAYLFSNEGDEVLLLISTIVNYFSFPTRRRNYGYRLGNVETLSEGFGKIADSGVLARLRVGDKTLADLSDKTSQATQDDFTDVANAFTYFDCTDYVDGPDNRGMLTEARNYKAGNPNGRIPWYEHLWLLFRCSPFCPPSKRINVHGGYFDGAVAQQLIYRLACLGFEDTAKAFGGEAQMMNTCAARQIRVMPSARLKSRHRRPIERMDAPQS
jgi:Putative serine esterase (DUF676)